MCLLVHARPGPARPGHICPDYAHPSRGVAGSPAAGRPDAGRPVIVRSAETFRDTACAAICARTPSRYEES